MFHFCLYSFTKNYSYGSIPMLRGRCLPRIKMEGGLNIWWSISYLYHIQQLCCYFHCRVCYQTLIQKPSSIFLTQTGISVFLFHRVNIWKEAFHLFNVIFFIWTCSVTSHLKGLLASVVSIFFFRWPLAQRESLAAELAFWLLNFPILRSLFTLAN